MTFKPEGPGETVSAFYERVARFLRENNALPIQEKCYGSLTAFAEITEARRRAFEAASVEAEGAFSFVGQEPCDSSALAGLHLWAVGIDGPGTKASVFPFRIDGKVVGRKFVGNGFCYLAIPSLGPKPGMDGTHPLKERAVSMFREVNRILEAGNLSYKDVARTWIYLPALLEWYGEFNEARRQVYHEVGLLDGAAPPSWLPASTGIQGACPQGRDCMMDFLALCGGDGSDLKMRMISSPGQCEAYSYGSSFARAVEVKDSSLSRIFVSGTASIDEEGKTVYVGDLEGQVRHTLAVVKKLLAARDHDFSNLAHGVVFLKKRDFADTWRRIAKEEGLNSEAVIETEADVCRDDLLIELEVLTVKCLPGV